MCIARESWQTTPAEVPRGPDPRPVLTLPVSMASSLNDDLCLALHILFDRLEGATHVTWSANASRHPLATSSGDNKNLTSDVTSAHLAAADYSLLTGSGGLDYEVNGAGSVHDEIKFCLSGIVNPVLCLFGLVGNIFNVLVLSRGRMKATLDCSMERAAHTGLVALAVSDIMYCLSAMCHSLFVSRTQTAFPSLSLQLYIQIYGPYLQNTFLHTGAWLTVIMAAGRYAAICRPLQARHLVGARSTRLAVVFTFVVWTLLDMPRLWTYEVVQHDCPTGHSRYYILDHGQFVMNGRLKVAFTYLWAIIGYLLPVLTLGYCNVHLVKALRESIRVRRLYRVNAKGLMSGSRISPTLVAIIFMYILLISPSEILHFCYYAVSGSDVEILNTAIVVTNLLQTMNFAFNFVLYCIVNVHFRQTSKELLLCISKSAATYHRSWNRSSTSYVTRASLLANSVHETIL